jgi:hypothetical protein
VAAVLAVLEDRAAAADNDLTRQKSDAALSEKGGVFCFSMQVYLRRDKYRGLVDKYHPYVTIARNTEKAVREKSKQVTYQPAIWGRKGGSPGDSARRTGSRAATEESRRFSVDK